MFHAIFIGSTKYLQRRKKSMIEQLSKHQKKTKDVLNIFTSVAKEAGWHMGGTEQILFTGN